MEGRAKVTKEVLCEEARFILANVMAEARYGRQNRYDDIRRVCEGAVSIPFGEYIGFLEKSGYLRHDHTSESLEVTPDGETVVNGGNLPEFTDRAVTHFKKLRQSRTGNTGAMPIPQVPGVTAPAVPPPARTEASQARPLPARDQPRITSSGGRATAMVGGEIDSGDQRYEKLAVLGSGGMGTVYRARQVALGREVALKEVRDLFNFFSDDQRNEIVKRFTDVVRAWGNIAHPNVLPIHDVNIWVEYPYLVTELAPYGSARRLIQDAEEIPVDTAFRYLLQTLHALRAAHAQKVFHRGLKPEQLLIDTFGNIKVSDFGFSRIVERDHAVIRQIYVGMGNVAYMAPELYTDPAAATAQTDIYALGIIFYELLTRRLPGRRSPMPSQINALLPKGIDDIWDRMTQDGREERYDSIEAILEDLDKLEGTEALLGRHSQVLGQDNPLAGVRFREGIEDANVGAPLESEMDDDKKGAGHRPYSFQQRRKKS